MPGPIDTIIKSTVKKVSKGATKDVIEDVTGEPLGPPELERKDSTDKTASAIASRILEKLALQSK